MAIATASTRRRKNRAMSNTTGRIFRLTTFGESHGPAIGGVVDGMPAGIKVDTDFIQHELDRRRPGQSKITTGRHETDTVELLSGVSDGVSTGCPIGFIVRNHDQHSRDYSELRDVFRPSHADYTYQAKYGIREYRGGGRSSARTTISRVVGGALAKLALREAGISASAYTSQVGAVKLEADYTHYQPEQAEQNIVRCPDPVVAQSMIELIEKVKAEGDTVGGVITGVIHGCPAGLGDPEFGKLSSRLAEAMMGINAAKGFEIGSGFASASRLGSELNDPFTTVDGRISTATNNSGGIQGGISNGEDIVFRVAFKPVPTILKEQHTVDAQGRATTIHPHGRHDPCVLPRAVPIVEAMAAMTVLDCLLLQKTVRL